MLVYQRVCGRILVERGNGGNGSVIGVIDLHIEK
jgi:hypothetical protein